MKSLSVALAAHFGGALTTLGVCLKMTRIDGVVLAATNHDVDIPIEVGNDSPPTIVTYRASAGGTDSDVQTSCALNVDTVDQQGVLSLDSITEEDLHAGLYDYAVFSMFVVNWADLSQGSYSLRDGNTGQVTLERDTWVAQLQGMMDAFKRAFGKLVLPICPYNLGDFPFAAPFRGRCTVDLSGGSADSPSIQFTVTGFLEGVSDDQRTLFDSNRLEPGPSGGIAITDISNADPGVVTLASPVGVPEGSAVTISGVLGPASLNTIVVVHNPSGNTFELAIDTSDTAAYPPYISGGEVIPLGAESGWFDNGVFTVEDNGSSPPSPNIGRRMEVKSYSPGQWTLQQEMPYPLVGDEAYTMVAGCDGTAPTCKGKFDNLNNFGGFPFVPGQDKSIQVAQPQSGQASDSKK